MYPRCTYYSYGWGPLWWIERLTSEASFPLQRLMHTRYLQCQSQQTKLIDGLAMLILRVHDGADIRQMVEGG